MVTLDMAEKIRGMRTARSYTQERLSRQLGLTPPPRCRSGSAAIPKIPRYRLDLRTSHG